MKYNLVYSHTNDFGNNTKDILFYVGDFLFWFNVVDGNLLSVFAEKKLDMIEHYDENGNVIDISDEVWNEQIEIAKELYLNRNLYKEIWGKY
jgi:hypothetical protein